MSRCSFGRAMTNALTTVMNVQCLDTCIDRYMSVFMRYALPIPIHTSCTDFEMLFVWHRVENKQDYKYSASASTFGRLLGAKNTTKM